MGKINRILRRSFISLNTMSAVDGRLMVFWAIQASAKNPEAVGSPSLVWVWVVAISVLCISCLGIYAGFSEKEIVLKIFAGFMVVGMITMLVLGAIVAYSRIKTPDKVIPMAVCFGYAGIALLGLLLSILMIRQVRRRDGSGGTSIAMSG